MFDWLKIFAVETVTFNSIFGICLYWLPLVVCFIGYTIRTSRNVQKDKAKRAAVEAGTAGTSYYKPTDTVGDLIGRALVSIIPIANLWAGMFDISPQFFMKIFKWIGRTFDMPLVPERKK